MAMRQGQAAALKVFAGDQNFVTQTYVAIEPTGLDPCDLRLQRGDAAVRELVARRVPLYRFVMSNLLQQHDLDRVDGRLAALRAAAPLVASIRDNGLVAGYVRELAGLLGMDIEEVRAEVMRAAARSGRRPSPEGVRPPIHGPPQSRSRSGAPAVTQSRRSAADHRATDREAPDPESEPVPGRMGRTYYSRFHPPGVRRSLYRCREGERRSRSCGRHARHGVGTPGLGSLRGDEIRSLVASLAVEPLPVHGEVTVRFVIANSAALQLLTVMRTIAALKSKLQRTNPVEEQHKYNQMFSELVVLEARRKALHTRSIGAAD